MRRTIYIIGKKIIYIAIKPLEFSENFISSLSGYYMKKKKKSNRSQQEIDIIEPKLN